MLGTTLDFLLVLLGFGAIIVLHELGHFLAARWAGIRVLAFSLGIGPALLSFRKGLGMRLGSSEGEVERLRNRGFAKGDVLEVARLAGIMGAKRTADLIPLCHPLPITNVTIDLEPAGDDTVEITTHWKNPNQFKATLE